MGITALRWFRRVVQVGALAAFVFLILRTASPISRLFLSFDPVVAFAGLARDMPRLLIVFGSGAVLLALTGGRTFCGWLCPMGAVIDMADFILLGTRRIGLLENRRRAVFRTKYVLLVALLVSSVLGVSLLAVLDPMSMLTRVSVASGRLSSDIIAYRTICVVFTAILFLGLLQRRFWCRNLCPLGAFLGVLGRFSFLRINVSKSCISCGACSGVCPTGAIEGSPAEVSAEECILCLNCIQKCPNGSISFGRRRCEGIAAVDMSRRHLLSAAGAGVAISLTGRLAAGDMCGVIRPPGSVGEQSFIRRCVRCGRCVEVCPTDGLQISVLESGIGGVFTPRMINRLAMEKGGCSESCNSCGQVCPTGAIRNLSMTEKSFAKMGIASVDRSRCMSWSENLPCLACQEVCPYSAIDSVASGDVMAPAVHEEACMGCGLCERSCPVEGRAAIEVSSSGALREPDGPFSAPGRVQLRHQRKRAVRSSEDW